MSKLRVSTCLIAAMVTFGLTVTALRAEEDEEFNLPETDEGDDVEYTLILEINGDSDGHHEQAQRDCDAGSRYDPPDAGPETEYGRDFCRCQTVGAVDSEFSLLPVVKVYFRSIYI